MQALFGPWFMHAGCSRLCPLPAPILLPSHSLLIHHYLVGPLPVHRPPRPAPIFHDGAGGQPLDVCGCAGPVARSRSGSCRWQCPWPPLVMASPAARHLLRVDSQGRATELYTYVGLFDLLPPVPRRHLFCRAAVRVPQDRLQHASQMMSVQWDLRKLAIRSWWHCLRRSIFWSDVMETLLHMPRRRRRHFRRAVWLFSQT